MRKKVDRLKIVPRTDTIVTQIPFESPTSTVLSSNEQLRPSPLQKPSLPAVASRSPVCHRPTHGMSPPPVQTARVLELGCASGGNLIPMADQMPQGQFLGIDLSERQIEDGQAQIRSTGLTNVELRHANILEFDPGEGTYDYIICHGVYSWVPEVVQQKILEVCSRGLSPQGVAYISYNTFPGWHMRGMIRDIMRYRAGFFEAPTQKLSQARGLLSFLSESVKSENNPYGMLLANELSAISGADDSYLFHEHLEEINDPIYFHTFAERAESVGLQYLGESDIGTMSLDNFPERVRAMLQSVSGNIIESEQYMDFLRNRMFRQTLLCRKEIELDRSLKPNRLIGMQVSSNARPEGPINLRSGERTLFKRGGSTLTTTEPEVKAAFLHLRTPGPNRSRSWNWPQSPGRKLVTRWSPCTPTASVPARSRWPTRSCVASTPA